MSSGQEIGCVGDDGKIIIAGNGEAFDGLVVYASGGERVRGKM